MSLSYQDVAPYITAISTILSVATLTFIINLTKRIDDLHNAKADLQNERLHVVQEQLAYVNNVRADLAKNVDKLNEQLSAALKEAGVTTESVASMSSFSQIEANLRLHIGELAGKVEGAIDELRKQDVAPSIEDPQPYLAVALARAATREWADAAQQYMKYLDHVKDNWYVYKACGVAFANSRQGREADVSAVRAFSQAIALLPDDFKDVNRRARLFTYRGAMFKRLGRLEESEADLHLASILAVAEREVLDLKYNLACVYAMRGNKQKMLSEIDEIKNFPGRERAISAIRGHMDSYFQSFANDADFLQRLK